MSVPYECPYCKKDLTGEKIPDKYKDLYDFSTGYFSKVIGIYDIHKDRTTHYKCPYCNKTWLKEYELEEKMKSYCYSCNADVEFRIEESTIETEIKDVVFSYLAKIAYCNKCGEEIYISKLSDENVRAANKEYRENGKRPPLDPIG